MPHKDPVALRAYKRAWDLKNVERRREQERARRTRDADAIRVYQKEWAQKNVERRRAVHKAWCDKKRESVRAYHNAYNATRREKNNAVAKRKRDELKDAPQERVIGLHLYVMQRSDAPCMLKIGRSTNPRLRAKDVSKHQTFDVDVIAAFDNDGVREIVVHAVLSSYRVRPDREWFELPPEIALAAIAQVLSNTPASSSSAPPTPPEEPAPPVVEH